MPCTSKSSVHPVLDGDDLKGRPRVAQVAHSVIKTIICHNFLVLYTKKPKYKNIKNLSENRVCGRFNSFIIISSIT